VWQTTSPLTAAANARAASPAFSTSRIPGAANDEPLRRLKAATNKRPRSSQAIPAGCTPLTAACSCAGPAFGTRQIASLPSSVRNASPSAHTVTSAGDGVKRSIARVPAPDEPRG
jgi:hypothetical protein